MAHRACCQSVDLILFAEILGSVAAFHFYACPRTAMGSKGCKFMSKVGCDEASDILGRLPNEPDEELTKACSCDILVTSKGLLRGCWGKFEAEAFYRPFPHHDMVKLIRHILIMLLDIEKYATREGETIENVEVLGEGSYAKVFGLGPVAAKVISDTERVWVHRAAVANSLAADREGFGPAMFGHGRVQQKMGGHFAGTVIFMERLQVFEEELSETHADALLHEVRKISKHGFHNDLKMPNILRRQDGQPVVIDFDLMSQWSVKVAVSSSCIEHDFQEVLEHAGERCTCFFREYYDLFVLSLTLEHGFLYRKILDRLRELWGHLEEPVLKVLLTTLGPELSELPFEVLIRVPLRGVSVCLLDLRGNLFTHLDETIKDIPDECLQLPQLLKSNGVYWPMETWKSSKSWKHMCEALLFCADMSSKCAASHLIIESKKYIEESQTPFLQLWDSLSQLLQTASPSCVRNKNCCDHLGSMGSRLNMLSQSDEVGPDVSWCCDMFWFGSLL